MDRQRSAYTRPVQTDPCEVSWRGAQPSRSSACWSWMVMFDNEGPHLYGQRQPIHHLCISRYRGCVKRWAVWACVYCSAPPKPTSFACDHDADFQSPMASAIALTHHFGSNDDAGWVARPGIALTMYLIHLVGTTGSNSWHMVHVMLNAYFPVPPHCHIVSIVFNVKKIEV